MNVRHILGIFGGKDGAAPSIGNSSVTSGNLSVVFLLCHFFVGSLSFMYQNAND